MLKLSISTFQTGSPPTHTSEEAICVEKPFCADLGALSAGCQNVYVCYNTTSETPDSSALLDTGNIMTDSSTEKPTNGEAFKPLRVPQRLGGHAIFGRRPASYANANRCSSRVMRRTKRFHSIV
jgi:hypothetical protein